jgi:hypothetical protein
MLHVCESYPSRGDGKRAGLRGGNDIIGRVRERREELSSLHAELVTPSFASDSGKPRTNCVLGTVRSGLMIIFKRRMLAILIVGSLVRISQTRNPDET